MNVNLFFIKIVIVYITMHLFSFLFTSNKYHSFQEHDIILTFVSNKVKDKPILHILQYLGISHTILKGTK